MTTDLIMRVNVRTTTTMTNAAIGTHWLVWVKFDQVYLFLDIDLFFYDVCCSGGTLALHQGYGTGVPPFSLPGQSQKRVRYTSFRSRLR